MKIMVTAGGTTEKIDSVRGISNLSTGKLGSLIADGFSVLPDVGEIYYICSKISVLPKSEKVKILYVDSVSSLESTVVDIISRISIDIIAHSMAVSDYRVKSVTSASNLAGLIVSEKEMLIEINVQNANLTVTSLLNASRTVIESNGKISSNIDDMLLIMERTPKVISVFQKISPKSILVGFKLLDNVPHETLIDTAFRLMQENKCSFVLANDLREIDEKQHIGYLINNDKNYMRLTTKEQIAEAVVAATMEKRRLQH